MITPAPRFQAKPASEPKRCKYVDCPFCYSTEGQILLHNAPWEVIVEMLRHWYEQSTASQLAAVAEAFSQLEDAEQ